MTIYWITELCLNIAGVEFEKPVSVDVVKYITRNDKNGVYAGDIYELFVF